MSYTGGNKREIQLSRNVSNENYNDYVSIKTNTGRNYIGTDHTVNTYYMGLEYSELYNIISRLDVAKLKNAKRIY